MSIKARRILVGASVLILGVITAAAIWLGSSPKPLALAPENGALASIATAPETAADPDSRPVYPFSIIPGGATTVEELSKAIKADPVVAAHFASFDLSRTRVETLREPRVAHVSYRKGKKIFWTRKPVVIPAGERVLTDGTNMARVRCGNCISTQAGPVSADEPPQDVFDTPESGPESADASAENPAPSVPGDPGAAGSNPEPPSTPAGGNPGGSGSGPSPTSGRSTPSGVGGNGGSPGGSGGSSIGGGGVSGVAPGTSPSAIAPGLTTGAPGSDSAPSMPGDGPGDPGKSPTSSGGSGPPGGPGIPGGPGTPGGSPGGSVPPGGPGFPQVLGDGPPPGAPMLPPVPGAPGPGDPGQPPDATTLSLPPGDPGPGDPGDPDGPIDANDDLRENEPQSVPEPGTTALMLVGAAWIARRKLRSR